MTNAPPQTCMPPNEQLVKDALGHMAASGKKSSVLELPEEVLFEACVRLITPGEERADVWAWAKERSPEDIPKTNWYRFCEAFGQAYKLIWGKYAVQVVLSKASTEGNGHVAKFAGVAQAQMMRLMAADLATTQTLSDLGARKLSAFNQVLRSYQRNEIETQELSLKTERLQQHADRLQAELRLADQKLEQLPERIKKLTAQIDEVQEATRRGKRIDTAVFAEIRTRLVEMAGGDEQPPEPPVTTT